MPEAGGTFGHRIGHAVLATGAVIAVCVLMVFALLAALICAPPLLRMAERPRDQAP